MKSISDNFWLIEQIIDDPDEINKLEYRLGIVN